MNGDEAEKAAREWFDGAPSLSADLGFEILDKFQFDYTEWEVKCRVFSPVFSQMQEYTVVIHDGVAICVR